MLVKSNFPHFQSLPPKFRLAHLGRWEFLYPSLKNYGIWPHWYVGHLKRKYLKHPQTVEKKNRYISVHTMRDNCKQKSDNFPTWDTAWIRSDVDRIRWEFGQCLCNGTLCLFKLFNLCGHSSKECTKYAIERQKRRNGPASQLQRAAAKLTLALF